MHVHIQIHTYICARAQTTGARIKAPPTHTMHIFIAAHDPRCTICTICTPTRCMRTHTVHAPPILTPDAHKLYYTYTTRNRSGAVAVPRGVQAYSARLKTLGSPSHPWRACRLASSVGTLLRWVLAGLGRGVGSGWGHGALRSSRPSMPGEPRYPSWLLFCTSQVPVQWSLRHTSMPLMCWHWRLLLYRWLLPWFCWASCSLPRTPSGVGLPATSCFLVSGLFAGFCFVFKQHQQKHFTTNSNTNIRHKQKQQHHQHNQWISKQAQQDHQESDPNRVQLGL